MLVHHTRRCTHKQLNSYKEETLKDITMCWAPLIKGEFRPTSGVEC